MRHPFIIKQRGSSAYDANNAFPFPTAQQVRVAKQELEHTLRLAVVRALDDTSSIPHAFMFGVTKERDTFTYPEGFSVLALMRGKRFSVKVDLPRKGAHIHAQVNLDMGITSNVIPLRLFSPAELLEELQNIPQGVGCFPLPSTAFAPAESSTRMYHIDNRIQSIHAMNKLNEATTAVATIVAEDRQQLDNFNEGRSNALCIMRHYTPEHHWLCSPSGASWVASYGYSRFIATAFIELRKLPA